MTHNKNTLAFIIARSFLTVLIISLTSITIVQADSFEEGRQAYINKEYERAFEILEPIAKSGKYEAQILIGAMYEYGHGVPADAEKSLAWHKLAAEQGIPAAQHDVGIKYFKGEGTQQDYRQALYWWEQAANGNFAESQYNLALAYFHGQGTDKNVEKSLDLFSRAANQGHVEAQYNLGVLYALSDGIPQDYIKARRYFSEAATQNHAKAQYNLGVLYENGNGVTADPRVAKYWYEQASRSGLSVAQNKLTEENFRSITSLEPEEKVTVAAKQPVESPPAAPAPVQADTVAKKSPPPVPVQTERTVVKNTQPAKSIPSPRPVMPTTPSKSKFTSTPSRGNWGDSKPRPIRKRQSTTTTKAVPPPQPAVRPTIAAKETTTTMTNDSLPKPVGNLNLTGWLKQQNSENYTLQLLSVGSEENVIKFLNRNGLQEYGGYAITNIDGSTRYAAVYGNYSSKSDAQAAISTLPATLQKPWIRKLADLQKYLY